MKTKILAVLAAFACLLGVGVALPSAASAGGQAETTQFTLYSTDSGLDANAQAAAVGWDKNTVVDLTTGSCSGFHCVTIKLDWNSCGSAGCATRYSDGSCLVQVMPSMMTSSEAVQNMIVAHEAGHCMGLPHNPNTRSVMYYAVNEQDPNWIISEDRRNLNAIWNTQAAKLLRHDSTTKYVVSQHAFDLAS